MANPPSDDVRISDNEEEHRYEAHVGPDLAGYLEYYADPGRVTLVHTEVDAAFEGRGIGSRLVTAALEDVRRREASVLPLCPFVRSWLQRHPEFQDLVGSGARRQDR